MYTSIRSPLLPVKNMTFAQTDNAKIYYETRGSGTPLTLVMGLGGTSQWWFPQTPVFAEHYNVIVLDNRGVGRTETANPNFTMQDMAADVIAVLDAAGIEKTHLCGISMGGMIAQHVALDYGDRIDKLILSCTLPGGMKSIQPAPEVAEALILADGDDDLLQAFQATAAILFPPAYLAEHMAELMMTFAEQQILPPSKDALAAQLGAVMGHDTFDRLGEITHPTLILHGDADVLVPPKNSELLARGIPHSTLELFPGNGHALNIQSKDEFNRAILEFLA